MTPTMLRLAGIVICVIAAVLMVVGTLSIGWGTAVGMVGIGLLGTSTVVRTKH
jgi:hypothetical protein